VGRKGRGAATETKEERNTRHAREENDMFIDDSDLVFDR